MIFQVKLLVNVNLTQNYVIIAIGKDTLILLHLYSTKHLVRKQ